MFECPITGARTAALDHHKGYTQCMYSQCNAMRTFTCTEPYSTFKRGHSNWRRNCAATMPSTKYVHTHEHACVYAHLCVYAPVFAVHNTGTAIQRRARDSLPSFLRGGALTRAQCTLSHRISMHGRKKAPESALMAWPATPSKASRLHGRERVCV